MTPTPNRDPEPNFAHILRASLALRDRTVRVGKRMFWSFGSRGFQSSGVSICSVLSSQMSSMLDKGGVALT